MVSTWNSEIFSVVPPPVVKQPSFHAWFHSTSFHPFFMHTVYGVQKTSKETLCNDYIPQNWHEFITGCNPVPKAFPSKGSPPRRPKSSGNKIVRYFQVRFILFGCKITCCCDFLQIVWSHWGLFAVYENYTAARNGNAGSWTHLSPRLLCMSSLSLQILCWRQVFPSF